MAADASMVHSIGIIGVGEIARAIVDGLCTGSDEAPDVFLSPRSTEVSSELARRHPTVRICAGNQEVVDNARLVIIAVRPDALHDALSDIHMAPGALVISVVAGASRDDLQRLLGTDVTIVRAIPLPAVRRRGGLTAVSAAPPAVTALFDRLGGTLEVADGDAFAALWAVTGAISAHLRYLATIADWAGQHGLDPFDADLIVRRIFAGVGGELADETRSLSDLAADHETRGGLNEQLRRAWFGDATQRALRAALDDLFHRVQPTC
jgi:pyrroline-5-carboxylate reductase